MDDAEAPPPNTGDPIDWARASFDALRAEIRALTGAVARQQASLDRAVQLDTDVAELARVLPERLGNAIAAAVEVRQDAFTASISEVTQRLESASSTLDEALGRTGTELETSTERLTTAARDAAISHQRVAEIADRTATNSDRLGELVASLPDRLAELTEAARSETEAVTGSMSASVDTLANRTAESVTGALDSLDERISARLAEVSQTIERAASGQPDLDDRLAAMGERLDSVSTTLAELRSATSSAADAGPGEGIEQLAAKLDELAVAVSRPAEPVAAPAAAPVDNAVLERISTQLESLAALTDTVARAEQIDGLIEASGRIRDAAESSARREDLTSVLDQLRRVTEQLSTVAGAEDLAAVATAVAAVQDRVSATVSADHVEQLSGMVAELREVSGNAGRAELSALRDSVGRLADNLGRSVTSEDLERVLREASAERDTTREALVAQVRDSLSGLGLAEAVQAVERATQAVDPVPAIGRIEELVASMSSSASVDALGSLRAAVDALGERLTDPTPAIDQLSSQLGDMGEDLRDRVLGAIEERLAQAVDTASSDEEAQGDARTALTELTVRLSALTEQLAAIDSLATADHVDQVHDAIRDQLSQVEVPAALDRVDRRLDELAARIPAIEEVAVDLAPVQEALAALATQLDEGVSPLVAAVADNPWPTVDEVTSRFDDVVARLNDAAIDLRSRLDAAPVGPGEARPAEVDLTAVLEAIDAIGERDAAAVDLTSVLEAIEQLELPSSGAVAPSEAAMDLTSVLTALDDLRSVSLETGAKVANLPQLMHEAIELLEEPIDLDFSDMVEQLTVSVAGAVRDSGGDISSLADRLDTLAGEVKAVARVMIDLRDAAGGEEAPGLDLEAIASAEQVSELREDVAELATELESVATTTQIAGLREDVAEVAGDIEGMAERLEMLGQVVTRLRAVARQPRTARKDSEADKAS